MQVVQVLLWQSARELAFDLNEKHWRWDSMDLLSWLRSLEGENRSSRSFLRKGVWEANLHDLAFLKMS